MLRPIWPMVLASALSVAAFAVNTPRTQPLIRPHFAARERLLSRSLQRASQFVDVPHISAAPACEDVQPPEALTTPAPLFTPAAQGKVKVSFIIGTDGRVHSPLILESAGLSGDRHILQTVRTWRYRPATCNGVPTGNRRQKIEFSGR